MVTHDVGLPQDDRAEATRHPAGLRICPTRIDRAPVLFAHKVAVGQCQDRQRGRYHKCFTCAWNNLWIGVHGAPTPTTEVERRSFGRAG